VALILGLTACSPGDTSREDAPAGKPGQGGTMTYLVPSDVPSLDPVAFSVPSNPASLAPRAFAIYDALAVDNPKTGALEMRLAEAITSADNLVWTIRLKSEVTFSDGTPFNAEAVRFNWRRIADPKSRAPMAPYALQMASMKVTDPLTLSVRLKAASAAFPRMVARYLTHIASPTAIKKKGKGFGSSPVGAGPYVVKEFVRDDHLTLDRNPRYFGDTHLDRLVIRPVVDETQRLNTLLSGEADAMFTSDPTTGARADDAGFDRIETVLNGGSNITFNVSRAPFNDHRARQAIALAFDQAALNRDLFDGLAQPVDTLFAPSSPYYDSGTYQLRPDRRLAQELMDDLAAARKPLKVAFVVPQSFSNRAEWFQTQLSRYRNIDVTLRVIPDVQAYGVAASGEFQAAFLASTWLYPEPAMTNYFGTRGTQNWGKYSNSDVDAALQQARTASDEGSRREAYAEVQREIVREVPGVFYFRPSYFVIHSRNVHDVSAISDGSPLWTNISISEK
jgi:peptide/nickel transport system substrate-binding protein